MYAGIQNMEKILLKCLITVIEETSEKGITKGNLEYTSTTVRRKRFLEFDVKEPLKSTFSLSKSDVVFINLPCFLRNLGFNSQQDRTGIHKTIHIFLRKWQVFGSNPTMLSNATRMK